jgi:tetratricopeptide (TPR) repeat protein
VGEPLWLASTLIDAHNDAIERGNWETAAEYLVELEVERLSENDRILLERLQAYRLIMIGEIKEAKALFDSVRERSKGIAGEAIDLELDLHYTPALIALAEGRAEEALAAALKIDDPTPNLSDVDLALYCALYLQDLKAIDQAVALVDTKPYRGQRVDLIRTALEGGRQAILGDRARAAGLLQEAVGRAVDTCTAIQAAWLASGARILGLDTPVGRELGSLAAELCERHSLGLITNLVPDGLVTEHRSSITA